MKTMIEVRVIVNGQVLRLEWQAPDDLSPTEAGQVLRTRVPEMMLREIARQAEQAFGPGELRRLGPAEFEWGEPRRRVLLG